MVQNDVRYNPAKDYSEVDQFGFVDIRKSMINGYVPNDLQSDSSLFNGIENPSSIVGKPSDIFESYRMMDSLANKVKEHTVKTAVSQTEN